MALLDRPLYGSEATGTLARVLAFRRTVNWPTVAKLPGSSCAASPAQAVQLGLYADAVAAWRALSDAARYYYNANKPDNLTGFNFFLKLRLLPELMYFGYCSYGTAWYELSSSPDQPDALDYDINFPWALDEFPILLDGAHSPQAWLMNRIYDTILSVQDYLILHKTQIET
jgi:hypothetical protein